jgi:hypothetical protein
MKVLKYIAKEERKKGYRYKNVIPVILKMFKQKRKL